MFKNRNFLKLWTSQMLSQVSINLMNFYVLTQVFGRTQSTTAVAMIWIASALPALLFGPFSGPIVDSMSRRKAMIVTNLLQAGSIALLFFRHQLFSFYSVVFLYSFFDQIYLPSQQASIPALVDKKHLPAANGLFLLTQQASVLLGFGLGGVLLAFLGNSVTIGIASIALVIAAIAVYHLPHDQSRTSFMEKDFGKFWKDLLTGYKYLRSHREIFLPLLMIICSQIFISVITIILPTFTHQVLGISLNFAGLILIVPGAIGALMITRNLPMWLKTVRKKVIIQRGLLIGSLTLILFSLVGLVPTGRFFLASLISIGIGMAIACITLPSQTLIQEKTPSWLRGRVYSQLSFLLIIGTTLPILAAGTLADIFGVSRLMGLMGLALFVIYFFFRKRGDYVLANGFGI
ncbi:MAG: hypothetical protein UX80_C0001G0007 [Candidatus Amesbacteria bacterium GW2011_GWA2_47_11b]|uniref:Major facilitator superfamily (MFS) profile domain-containing protein n=3 Tax=Candidatus Amesiibacteriota TaxID=1752730 RepID=A0A0G1SK13_9BACT|nr:MAG: hypothetical protein UX42_C0026G0002 [Microgenomates group bacterium GW2011_GWC1_46_20]KKU58568.1 MAG: hypothetical protein UX80_C0001G0007 [Candidatus Amesbacteria bacterium GW2011_GWA2_47_11b]KKU69834.1 MAG: hypothetical protein UX92_C0008G0002 [Candidatus Amesbacteria bacterium GW2011_GWA1_47_20]KKU84660.1 MAG: hypothetical protein UY11_C0005G0034 [Candidatus Amesbacteria bacterium GW2011_GWC2_47_8]